MSPFTSRRALRTIFSAGSANSERFSPLLGLSFSCKWREPLQSSPYDRDTSPLISTEIVGRCGEPVYHNARKVIWRDGVKRFNSPLNCSDRKLCRCIRFQREVKDVAEGGEVYYTQPAEIQVPNLQLHVVVVDLPIFLLSSISSQSSGIL